MGFVIGQCVAAQGDDWPAWRGADRTGRSAETGLADSWTEAGPTELWRIDTAGTGFSTPSIKSDRIYLMGNVDRGEWVHCLDAGDAGATIWSYRIGDVRHEGAG